MRGALLVLEYKTSLSTSFSRLLLLAYFFTIITRNLYLTCTGVSSKIVQFTYFKRISCERVHTRRTLTLMHDEEYPSILRKQNLERRNFYFYSLPQKNSPPFTGTRNFSCDHRARFNVLCTFACYYLLLLEFLKKITHRALHRPRIREGEGQPPGNFFFFIDNSTRNLCT